MLGKTIQIRGEVSGDEDLVVDGQIEGKIDISRRVKIGRNATVQADIRAANVEVSGKVQGNITAEGRVEIDGSATVVGNVTTSRISISDGAFFKGTIEMTRDES